MGNQNMLTSSKEVLLFDDKGLFSLDLKYFRSAKSGIVSYGDDHIPVVASLYTEYLTEKFGAVKKERGTVKPVP